MKIRTAPHAGFCFGVRAAVKKGEELAESGFAPLATLGPLIHNPQEVARLETLGITARENLFNVPEKFILLRTHGVAPSVYQAAEQAGLQYEDCTCPKVKRVQKIARDYADRGYEVLILGDAEHPEVQGIVGWARDKAHVFYSVEELANLSLAEKKVCLVSQTTEKPERFDDVVKYLEQQTLADLVVYNTICSATRERQNDCMELAQEVDLMIVIGGYNSANTCKLVTICRDAGAITYHVENADELKKEYFQGIESVGITAGASTPDWIIREVMNKMEELTMEQGLEQGYGTLEPLNLYDVVTGTVVKINPDEVMVDVGGKSEGVIPTKELSFQKDPVVEDIVNVGDEIQVMVIKMENAEGHMVLSKKRADQEKAMDSLQEKFENGDIIEAKVVSDVKGGVIVDIGARGFVPASHLDTKYVEDIKSFVGNTYKFKLIEFDPDPRNRKIILSRRVLLEEEEKEQREKLWEEIQPGEVRTGIVQRIASFGAFVDLGGVDGLLHISEMGWGRVKQPTDVVNVGDEIEVYILAADEEKGKISLSLKKLLSNPWDEVEAQFPVGEVVKGTVVRLAPFGAFVSLADGVDGLVHISQIAWEHVEKVEDALSVGDEVEVKVLEVDKERKRISLSIKELKERPESSRPTPRPKRQSRPKSNIPVVNEDISTNLGDLFNLVREEDDENAEEEYSVEEETVEEETVEEPVEETNEETAEEEPVDEVVEEETTDETAAEETTEEATEEETTEEA